MTSDQVERLRRYCETLCQGDVLHVHAFSVLGAPESTLNEDTREAAEFAEFRVTSVERRLESGLWVLVTQTCDIRRSAEKEPFLHTAPLLDVGERAWSAAKGGSGTRAYFAYDPLEDLKHPVLDIRLLQTMEKTALVAEGVDPFDPGLSPLFRKELATWLARRFARHAFPAQLENACLRRLRETIAKRKGDISAPTGKLIGSLEGIWVAYDADNAEFLFLVRQEKAAMAEAEESDLSEGAEQLMAAVARRNEHQGSPYRLQWRVSSPSRVPASDLLYRFHPVDFDAA